MESSLKLTKTPPMDPAGIKATQSESKFEYLLVIRDFDIRTSMPNYSSGQSIILRISNIQSNHIFKAFTNESVMKSYDFLCSMIRISCQH